MVCSDGGRRNPGGSFVDIIGDRKINRMGNSPGARLVAPDFFEKDQK
jgi:hypothetical protein